MFLSTPSRTWARYPINWNQRSFGEIPPPPALDLFPADFARRSVSSIASTSFATTRDLTSGATFRCVDLRRLDIGPGKDTGVNSSLRALLNRRRTSRTPTFFVRIDLHIPECHAPYWGRETIEIPAWRGCRLRNYPGPAVLWTMLRRWNVRQLLVFLAVPARFRASENSSSRFKMGPKRDTKPTSE